MTHSPEKGSVMPDQPQLEQYSSEHVLCQGEWQGGVPWQFLINVTPPLPEVCTAVFGVVEYQGQIVLIHQAQRGWELPGGHLDPHESLQTALAREVNEETGFTMQSATYFGHKRVTPKAPISRREGGFYPFPASCVPYYWVKVAATQPTELASDVTAIKILPPAEAIAWLQQHNPHQAHDLILSYVCQQQGSL